MRVVSMLVFVSDLHLTNGTTGRTPPFGAFEDFGLHLRQLAYQASRRGNGRHDLLDRIDLVLLGDILDVIRSADWLNDRTRPWDDPAGRAFQTKVAAVTDSILRRNSRTAELFRRLSRYGVPSLPCRTRRVSVRVHIHYMVGNHDWFYHLPGPAYDQIRRRIGHTLGLTNSPDEPFPHDPDESAALKDILRQHRVVARHGDVYDAFNYQGSRDASSLGDAVVIELLNRFPLEVRRLLGCRLPRACLAGLTEIDRVRPVALAPVWIDALLRRSDCDHRTARQVKLIWNRLTDRFRRLSFVRAQDRAVKPMDHADQLDLALLLSKGVSLKHLSRLAKWWSRRGLRPAGGLYKRALAEPGFKDGSARFVVYGHTHRQEIIPLDGDESPRGAGGRFYFNSGAWGTVHELARLDADRPVFVSRDVMSWLVFYKDDERSGRAFETFSTSTSPYGRIGSVLLTGRATRS